MYCHRNFDRQRGRERERRAHARICFVQFFDTPNSLSLSSREKNLLPPPLSSTPLPSLVLARRLPLIVRLAPLSDSSLSRPSTKKTPDNETRSPRLPLLLPRTQPPAPAAASPSPPRPAAAAARGGSWGGSGLSLGSGGGRSRRTGRARRWRAPGGSTRGERVGMRERRRKKKGKEKHEPLLTLSHIDGDGNKTRKKTKLEKKTQQEGPDHGRDALRQGQGAEAVESESEGEEGEEHHRKKKKCSVILRLLFEVDSFSPDSFSRSLSFFQVYLCFPLQHARLPVLSRRQRFGGDEICASIARDCPQSDHRRPCNDEEEHRRPAFDGAD